MHRALRLIWVALLSACSQSAKPPDGYVEACYGGSFSKQLVGKTPSASADLELAESEWPKLTAMLEATATRHNLRFFKDNRNDESLSMIHVSVCSSDGFFLYADKRVWRVGGASSPSRDSPVFLSVYLYKQEDKWARLTKELLSELSAEWPERVTVPSRRTSQLGYELR